MKISYQSAVSVAVLGLVAACGGGGGGKTSMGVLSDKLSTALSSLSTSASLTASQISDLFDSSYKEDGVDLAALKANNDADTSAKDSVDGFPSGTLSNIKITNCDSKNICDMTADLTNTDADTTTVSFTTKVISSNGSYKLYGNQS